MAWDRWVSKAAGTVVTGVVGVAAYEMTRAVVKKLPVRAASVSATALGLRGVRKAEEGAERARLSMADVIAEARERIGEEATPPSGDVGGDHHHDH